MSYKKIKDKPFKRGAPRIEERRIILVITEGHTEGNYFSIMKNIIRFQKTSLQILNPFVTHPLSLLKEVTSYSRRVDFLPDETWIVFDADIFKSRVDYLRLLQEAEKKNVKWAMSHPCFEYWLLLHFTEYQQKIQGSREAVALLQRFHPNYQKEGKLGLALSFVNRESVLLASVHAQRRRHRVEKLYRDSDELMNPQTNVDQLIQAICAGTL